MKEKSTDAVGCYDFGTRINMATELSSLASGSALLDWDSLERRMAIADRVRDLAFTLAYADPARPVVPYRARSEQA